MDLNNYLEIQDRFYNDIYLIIIDYIDDLYCNDLVKYYDYNWDNISEHKYLSEGFINKCENKVNWDYISCSQKLSEIFIEKYKNKINWKNVYGS